MAASLLDSLTGLITPDLASKAASMFGESDSSVRKGMTGALPVVLSGLASRAGDSGFAGSLFDLVRSPANDDNVLNDLGGLLGGGTSSPMMGLGGKLLSTLFGGNIGNVASALAGYAGVKSSTGASLLNLAAPLVLAVLGRKTRSEGLNASSLASLLLGQKDSFAAALPGPLANIGTLGTPTREREAYAAPPPVAERRSSIWRWLVPLLIALGLLWLLSSLFGRKERPVEEATPPAAMEPAPLPAPEPETVAPAAASPTATVYFDVDQSGLPAGSDTALSSVIAYLKANPASTAVISGYHDPTGDQAANEELAKNRAGSVRDALVAGGIEEARITMEKPVVTTGGGSLEDARRVEVTVR
ncbi:MAG TPA: OmpA family protein [Steroidobacteraceae bacterium]|jgi:outer membrane protein OmpA-like peptidoglycan-associated protein|nr:OmpA family protein [Steroidobacteraceae bacterium]